MIKLVIGRYMNKRGELIMLIEILQTIILVLILIEIACQGKR